MNVIYLVAALLQTELDGLATRDIDAYVSRLERNRVACGPVCVWYCLRRFGRAVPVDQVINAAPLGERGISVANLIFLVRRFNLPATALSLESSELEQLPVPSILFLNDEHCVVFDGAEHEQAAIRIFEPVNGRVGPVPVDELRSAWSGEAIIFEWPYISPVKFAGTAFGTAMVVVAAFFIIKVLLINGRNYINSKHEPLEL